MSQAQGTNPAIKRVYNPLGAELGCDRERSEDAVDRLFGPGDAVPTLPSDFERLARQALAPRADGWLVRCWTYAERTLMQHAMWPLSRDLQSPPDPDVAALRAELASAGPDQVLFAIAAPEGELSEPDLAWARGRLDNRIRRLRDRLPSVRGAVVCRSWALTLSIPANVDPPDVLPAFSTDQWRGTLRDSLGRSAPCPANTLLLNAAIVAVTRLA